MGADFFRPTAFEIETWRKQAMKFNKTILSMIPLASGWVLAMGVPLTNPSTLSDGGPGLAHPFDRRALSAIEANAPSQDICSFVTISTQLTGPTCCWELTINNGIPPGVVYVLPEIQVSASAAITSVTAASGWNAGSPTSPATSVVLTSTASPLPAASMKMGTLCLGSQSAQITVQWLVGSLLFPDPIACATTVFLNCPYIARICGSKVEDMNGDAKWDGYEPLLGGWKIVLTDANGNTLTTTTDKWGSYCFNNLAPGVYTVAEVMQSGWQAGSTRVTETFPSSTTTVKPGSTCQITLDKIFECTMCTFFNKREEAETKACPDRTETLNTGLDSDQSLILVGQPDSRWAVTADPDPATTEPRPATVINPQPSWRSPLSNSRWVSPGAARLAGNYEYQTCFCLDEDDVQKAKLVLTLRAADEARVFLNGTQIGRTPPQSFNTDSPTHLETTSGFHPGMNCLKIVVTSPSTSPSFPGTGFNLAGTGTAGDSLCCEGGAICGISFHDQNGDGAMDAGEPGLDGWVIILRDASGNVLTTATTAGNGRYCFMNLAPGRYTIAQVQLRGWTQTFPPLSSGSPPGTHMVDLESRNGMQHLDFGNRR
jgi:hypothetical protein